MRLVDPFMFLGALKRKLELGAEFVKGGKISFKIRVKTISAAGCWTKELRGYSAKQKHAVFRVGKTT